MEQLRWSRSLRARGQRKHLLLQQQRGCRIWFPVSSYNPAIPPSQQCDCRTSSAKQSASAQHDRVASPSTRPADISSPRRNESRSVSSEDASRTLPVEPSYFLHILRQSSQKPWHVRPSNFLWCKFQVRLWPGKEHPVIVWKWGKTNWMQSGTGSAGSRGFAHNILQCG